MQDKGKGDLASMTVKYVSVRRDFILTQAPRCTIAIAPGFYIARLSFGIMILGLSDAWMGLRTHVLTVRSEEVQC